MRALLFCLITHLTLGLGPLVAQRAGVAPANSTVAALAGSLTSPAQPESERAHALYRWITENIAYDVEMLLSGAPAPMSAQQVLHRRAAICDGYATLFLALAAEVGLEARRIDGFARGVGFRADQKTPNHAWAAVRLDGRWELLDPTWGAGSVDGDRFIPYPSDHWFRVAPEQMILTHLPVDARWQMLGKKVSRREFERMPQMSAELLELGFSAGQLLREWRSGRLREMPLAYQRTGPRVAVVDAPLSGVLLRGREYRFAFVADSATTLQIETGGRWTRLDHHGGQHEGRVRAVGDALILYRFDGDRGAGVLRYRVADAQ
jgi:hypothetical protein